MTEKSNHRIVFVNEASPLIGMGHILRSQVLARTMYTRGYSISGLTIGEAKAVLYAEERTAAENFVWPILRVLNSQAAIDHILSDKPNLTVVDCTKAGQDIVLACASAGLAIVALDHFSSENPLPSAVINLIDQNKHSLVGQPPSRDGVEYFEGPKYAIIREDFLQARAQRFIRQERELIKNILITFGGADPAGNSYRVLTLISTWPGKFIVDIVVGPLFASKINGWTDILIDNCVIRTHTSPILMGKLFENADIIFCGGGGTLLEALCVGLPAIVMSQNDAEINHAKSFVQLQACWIIDHVTWEIVSQVKNRKMLSVNALKCVDGLGAERVCTIFEDQIVLNLKNLHNDFPK
jgi:spore coat polysaccharide biosynthesis predicted glycosyltransferase SpsG